MTDTIEPMAVEIDQLQLAKELVEKARADGVELVGPDGMPRIVAMRSATFRRASITSSTVLWFVGS